MSVRICRIWDQELVLLAAASSVTFVSVWKTSDRRPSAIFVSRTRYNNYTFREGEEACYRLNEFFLDTHSFKNKKCCSLGVTPFSHVCIDGRCGLFLRAEGRRSSFLRDVSRFVQNRTASQPKLL